MRNTKRIVMAAIAGLFGLGAVVATNSASAAPAQEQAQEQAQAVGFLIPADMNNRCLTVAQGNTGNGDNGAMLNLFDCQSSWKQQQWHWNGNELRNRINEKCLTVPGANWWQGASVSLWDCVNAREQKWHTS